MTEPMQPHLFDPDEDPAAIAIRNMGGLTGRNTRAIPLSARPNPMIAAVGAYEGEPGKIRVCGDCVFLVWKGGHSRRYFGCEKRGPMTNGPATDHLSGWHACALFVDDRDETVRRSK